MIERAITRPVTVVMGFIALVLMGVIAWRQIPLEMMPGDFEFNRMWIWVPVADTTPQEALEDIVRPIEEQLATTPGLRELESRARSSGASFEVSFHRSMDLDTAYNAMIDRLDRAMPDLPDEVERYWVYRWNPDDTPIIYAGLSLPDHVEDRYATMEQVVARHIERVDGVGKVEFWGVDPKRIFLEFDVDLLTSHGLGLWPIMRDLGADNFQLASGRITDRGKVRYVRSLARYEDLDDLKKTQLKPGVRLEDVATIQHRLDLSPDINRINGDDGAGMAIYKESGANTVATSAAVAAAIEELKSDPRLWGLEFVTFFDQGEVIQGSVNDLTETALWGSLFAVIVLYAFLRAWRMTLLIAGCIPFTMLLTVAIMHFSGGTMNLLSLLGLMLAVGMVVDNAIVVVEAIFARRQAGDAPHEGAITGTRDVALAITMSTLTTMVVFLPVILMSDDPNFTFFMGELGLPVVFALLASLLVAVIFVPLATKRLGGHGGLTEPAWITWLTQRYTAALRRVLSHRTDSLMSLVAMIGLTIVLPLQAVDCDGEEDGEPDDFVVRYEIPSDFGYRDRVAVIETYEAWVEENRARWGVKTHRSRLSSSSQHGRTYIHFEDRDDGQMPTHEAVEEARLSLPHVPGVTPRIGWDDEGQPGKSLTIRLKGDDMATLEELGTEITRFGEAIPGVLGVHREQEDGDTREARLHVDRAATSRLGVDAAQVGQTVAYALRANQLPDFHDGDRPVDVIARFQYADRQDLDTLLDFRVWNTTTWASAPVRALVHTEYAPASHTIRRQDRITSYALTFDLGPDADKAAVMASLSAALAQMDFPRGTRWTRDRSGEWDDEESDEARDQAMILTVLFVFFIMGVLFESFLLPFAIITTIPMAMMGVYWTLYLTNTPLDVMGGVGMVVLVGVVVNNGIVLVDLVTRLRAEGLDRTDALVQAGGRRLRPILMTALTTIFGLLPMAVGNSDFVGMPYAPLGRVVMGGLLAGTVLTLFYVPFLYTVLDDISGSGKRWLGWVVGRKGAIAASALLALGLVGRPAHALDISFDDAVQQALDRNPELLAAGFDVEAAQGGLLSARAIFEPVLNASTGLNSSTGESVREFGEVVSQYEGTNASAGITQSLPTGTTATLETRTTRSNFRYELPSSGFVVESEDPVIETRVTASVRQSLLEGHRRATNLAPVRTATRALDSAQLALLSRKQQVVADVANAYWALHYQQQLVDISKQAMAVAEEERRVVRAQVAAGELAGVEQARVDAAVVQAERARIETDNAAAQAADTLLLLLAQDPGQSVTLTTEPAAPSTATLDVGALVATAAEHNPEIRTARLAEEGAAAELEDARHKRMPQLTATGSYSLVGHETSTSAAMDEMFAGDLPEWNVGGELSIPLGNRADRGTLQTAQATSAQATSAREATERAIAQQVMAQARTLHATAKQAELATANLHYAEETLKAERALQALGRAIQKDVLESIRAVDDARAQLAKAQADHLLAQVELDRLTGS